MTLVPSPMFPVKFNVCQRSSNSHPLHVAVSESVAEKFSVATEDKAFIAALSKAGEIEDTALLVSVCVRGRVNDDCIPFLVDDPFMDAGDGTRDCPVALWCTSLFLEHYKIERNDTYFIKKTEVYPLKKIIFGAKNQDTFKWTQEVNFGTNLVLSVCQGNVLVRENDVLLAPYPRNFSAQSVFKSDHYFDLVVLECAPVCQGILTVNTEIMVIVYDSVQNNMSEIFPSKVKTEVSEETLLKRTNLCVSDFSSTLNELNINSRSLQKSAGVHSRNSPSQCSESNGWIPSSTGMQGFVLCPFILPKQDMWSRMLLKADAQVCFDPLYIIGMSRSLMLKHGLFDGAVVQVSCLESRSSPQRSVQKQKTSAGDDGSDVDCLTPPISSNMALCQSSRPDADCGDSYIKLAQVKMLKREYDSIQDVYVSPLLLFNLHPSPSSSSTPLLMCEKYSNKQTRKSLSSVSSSWDCKLPYAKEIQISLVNSSEYSPLSSFSEALKKYFQVPRAVCVGDVIAVKSGDDPGFYQSLSDGIEARYPVIYFKIIRIEPESDEHQTYIGDDKQTTLIQIGSVHSYIPAGLESYLSKGDNLSYWEKPHLKGLERYTDTLEALILPYLSKRKFSVPDVQPCILLSGQDAIGKTAVVQCVSRKLGLQVIKVGCNTVSGETSAATEARLKKVFESACFFSPCVLLLQQVHVIGKDREQNLEDVYNEPQESELKPMSPLPSAMGGAILSKLFLSSCMVKDTRVSKGFQDLMTSLLSGEFPVIVIATTAYPKLVSHDIQQCFLHHVTIEVSSELERSKMIQGLLSDTRYSCDVDTAYIAQRTAGFVLGDFVALLAQVKKAAINRICKQCGVWPTELQEEAVRSAGVIVQMSDVIEALNNLQSAQSSSMGAPNIPDVRWEDIGGLTEVREEILDTIQLPLQHPELLAAGLRRSGVLLYGPPGSGKTLLAKAVATECSLNFLSVKGPELINKYVGQSEENVREVFRRARDASPCVIFFDELDSLAPNRGRSGDSGGVMDRVVSQMLAELDGLHKSLDVFVIGATNRPDLLDPALIRPGRFDKPLYLGVSTDKPAQVKILKALTRKFTLEPEVNLQDVAEECPMTLTGADFYALCSDAMLNALKRKIELLKSGETVDQDCVSVRQDDFLSALRKLTPSVSEQELQHYEKLRRSLTAKK